MYASPRKFLLHEKDGFVVGWTEYLSNQPGYKTFESMEPPPEYIKDLDEYKARQSATKKDATVKRASGKAKESQPDDIVSKIDNEA